MRTILFILFGLNIIQSSNSQNNSSIDWTEDLDYIKKQLPRKHYDLFATQSKDHYLHGLERIESSSCDMTNFEITVQLQQLIASMGDSHTKVNIDQFIDKNQVLPLHLYWFNDGLYILHTTPKNTDILGCQIISINQTPIQTVVDSLSTLFTVDNQSMIKKSIPRLVPLIQVLDYFEFSNKQHIELGLKDVTGHKKIYIIEPAVMTRKNRVMYQPDSLALCFRNERALFVDYYQAKDNIYYIQYNKCWSKELELKHNKGKNADKLPSFKDFQDKVFSNLETQAIDKIVFDLRFNGGGSSGQGGEFIEKFAKYASSNPEKQIFVILGRSTFSSAILNAMDFKSLTNATFVGEDTAGKPNHFGEVRNFRLPHSNLRVNYSTKFFELTEEDINTLSPDKKIEANFDDFSRGIDPVYDWIRMQ